MPVVASAPDAVADRLQALLARAVEGNRHVRHGLLAVSWPGVEGPTRWLGAHGIADAEDTPVTTATPYPVASVTKLVTAVVVLRLCERGALTLTDRLVDRLDAAATARLHVLDGTDHTEAITLEHLLSHTSGLGDPLDSPRWEDTVNVAPGERYSVLVPATDPGTWVFHCHILNHVESDEGMFGMVTALIVE